MFLKITIFVSCQKHGVQHSIIRGDVCCLVIASTPGQRLRRAYPHSVPGPVMFNGGAGLCFFS